LISCSGLRNVAARLRVLSNPVASQTNSARGLAHSKTGELPRRCPLRAASWSAAVFCRFGIGSHVLPYCLSALACFTCSFYILTARRARARFRLRCRCRGDSSSCSQSWLERQTDFLEVHKWVKICSVLLNRFAPCCNNPPGESAKFGLGCR
jgi:hypothetical protein